MTYPIGSRWRAVPLVGSMIVAASCSGTIENGGAGASGGAAQTSGTGSSTTSGTSASGATSSGTTSSGTGAGGGISSGSGGAATTTTGPTTTSSAATGGSGGSGGTASGAGTGGAGGQGPGTGGANGKDAGSIGGSVGVDAGRGGSAGSVGTGGSGGGSPTGVQQLCVDTINMYRATLGLAPYARWNVEETCADGQAQSDSVTGTAHGAFTRCTELAQNECPGWPTPQETAITGCLQAMWNEGPGADFATHGHYINMSSTQYRMVACGFFTTAAGKVWAVQDFR